jgi:hypothetical protein
MNEELARRIALYLFLHKWLAPAYSPEMLELLVKAIMEGADNSVTI